MRHSWILSLVAIVVTASISCAQSHPSPQQGRQRGKPNRIFKVNGGDNIPERVIIVSSQWNLDKNEALADALEKARDQIESYLQEQKRSTEWTPKLSFIRERLLSDLLKPEVELRKKELAAKNSKGDLKGELEEFMIDDRIRAVEETREFDEQQERETKRVWLKVVVNTETWKQIQTEIQLAQDYKRVGVMRSRMVFLVKFLAGIVALLGTICAYLRLDEWSKGYYTKWLRLAAVGCAGAVTVFLWMLVAR
jgi:hypothetical protein